MAVLSDYVSGTITLTNGSNAFTGTGTGWLAASFREGDTILGIESNAGVEYVIATIDGNGAGTLTQDWEGATGTYTYRMRYLSDGARVTAQAAQLVELLGNGNLQALAGLTGPGVPVFNGPHSMTIKPETDFINGVAYDVQVDTLPDRAAYDGQSAGFSVLVSDIGDGRSAIYSKNTNAAGDWSDAAYITGPVGDTGPYTDITVGPVTTLPYGQPASVDVVQVDPETIRLDFSIPKGMDGAGTGDMVGPSSSTVNGFVGFADAGGKQTKQLTSAQATAGLDVFDVGLKGLVPAPSSGDVSDGKFLKADGTWAEAAGGGTGAFLLPSGSTAQRPSSPTNGMIRYNTTENSGEIYEDGKWLKIGSSPYTYEIEYLVIAGGGAGGSGEVGVNFSGGGGAGGYRSSVAGEISGGGAVETPISVEPGGASIPVVIGAGGTKGASNGTNNTSGSDSSFGDVVSTGGGRGSGLGSGWIAALTGGSGGGGSEGINAGGSGTTSQGFAGGNAPGASNSGSGGGGAGGIGGNGSANAGGSGGNGITSSINGTPTARAGGGGGNGASSNGTANSGGSSGSSASSASDATANTGGGGGAGNTSGGNGGSGIVIIRYLGAQRGTGGTVTADGGYTIHTFTGSGSYNP